MNNDGLLDLFIVNYMQWTYSDKPLCAIQGVADYCHPKYYKGQPNQLFLNKGDGTFHDVSKEWGIRDHVGKGMGVGMADYDLDGRQDLFVTNDAAYNFALSQPGQQVRRGCLRDGRRAARRRQLHLGHGAGFSRLQ